MRMLEEELDIHLFNANLLRGEGNKWRREKEARDAVRGKVEYNQNGDPVSSDYELSQKNVMFQFQSVLN